MGDPRKTRISSITDRIVRVRHASPIEREIVFDRLPVQEGTAPDPLTADIVVAAEDERLIGFAVLQRSTRGEDSACLAVVMQGGRRGIGEMVVRHLLEHATVSRVLAGRESARYMERAGFHRISGQRGKPKSSEGCAIRGVRAGSAALYAYVRSEARKELQR